MKMGTVFSGEWLARLLKVPPDVEEVLLLLVCRCSYYTSQAATCAEKEVISVVCSLCHGMFFSLRFDSTLYFSMDRGIASLARLWRGRLLGWTFSFTHMSPPSKHDVIILLSSSRSNAASVIATPAAFTTASPQSQHLLNHNIPTIIFTNRPSTSLLNNNHPAKNSRAVAAATKQTTNHAARTPHHHHSNKNQIRINNSSFILLPNNHIPSNSNPNTHLPRNRPAEPLAAAAAAAAARHHQTRASE